jgi:6-phosphogluconolactonase
MHIKTFTNQQEFIDQSLNLILENPGKIALSGGSTPKPIYQALAGQNISQFEFYQVDDRYVPKEHEDSNNRMITECGIPLKGAFKTSLSIPKCVEEYQKKIPPTPFDLCILGIGTDGHTASLFPKSPVLNSTKKVEHSITHQFSIKDRLTLTFPTILESKKLLVLLKNKPEVLKELKNPKKSLQQFPALKLLEHPRLSVFYLS